MKTFTTRRAIREYLSAQGAATIGFVPTMGALHNGHLSLIAQAKQANDITVCSIFVNPTQFNDAKDLEKYPRPIEADMAKLEQAGCDILFNPAVNEMYDDNEQWHLNIGRLEYLLEGEFRPGHYQGVMQVVFKLLDIVKPTNLYMGQKDYQQIMVVNKMIELLNIPVNMVMCPIEREAYGLAMSSRNVHLTAEDRQHALVLSKTLNWVKDNFDRDNITELQQQAMDKLAAEEGVEPEYFRIVDGKMLLPASENTQIIVALTAARVGKTRLIDNVLIR
ncbi:MULTISPECIES: pantoate--beta-alanine ligase [unclassified Mucilaginibacter]|uniref:pantoate--beta-alanine ligase n=1 Tax=unclassified Mucilaginibacter TaxID=2617802 RepID=UPI002AC9D731|nr:MULTISPECIES: pantoate--beta-alanine ligase [unclassified Mucilaginibacter]MEB0263340.1 pantoate--beta-alanine ligase [Mucilaginibacter sp. 10I4]MEB0279703.1 pantoate--beta-alanine ligase [Mucilaginibacter sp. 10B2]MEB0303250.1 pantoate--beta-alanine ligase [Mucilaginibacter sp. 5C4]WPX23738.1 pantoate--beta-alanine ligase [Mucilaginibacter sp. 5C4]